MRLPIELTHPCYRDEEAARTRLESIRWPDGPFCPYCGSAGRVKQTTTPPKAKGGGWFHCQDCRRKFTVRVGSIFHRSHVPLHKWLLGFRLMAGSKKGFSAHQLHRTLAVDYKTAWFLGHRIRACMKKEEEDGGADPIGGPETFVEADETFAGGKAGNRACREPAPKNAVVSQVERSGRIRSRHVADGSADNPRPIRETGAGKALHSCAEKSAASGIRYNADGCPPYCGTVAKIIPSAPAVLVAYLGISIELSLGSRP